jgi:hypothetical protein
MFATGSSNGIQFGDVEPRHPAAPEAKLLGQPVMPERPVNQ